MPDTRPIRPGWRRIFRTTTFRFTVISLAICALAASAFLSYIYVATVVEARRRTDQVIAREAENIVNLYRRSGPEAVSARLVDRAERNRAFIYVLTAPNGQKVVGSIDSPPAGSAKPTPTWLNFSLVSPGMAGNSPGRPVRGLQQTLSGGEVLFVGFDVGDDQAFILKIVHALWGAGALVLALGLAAGLQLSRNVSQHLVGLTNVVATVRNGNLSARAGVEGSPDEFHDLAKGLNQMLDRLERSMAAHRHAGDAIAHDLRSPLTRLRARLEVALCDLEAGQGNPEQALSQALEDTDAVLKTFSTVLAIARLQSEGDVPSAMAFDPAPLVSDIADLYEPLCEDKGVQLASQVAEGLTLRGNQEFIAQALANLVDNAVKYTPSGGGIMLRLRSRASGDLEFSVTDTGPGVPDADRSRIVERFVRLEGSRNAPGAGLGLSLVAAVANAHGGRLELAEGPGKIGDHGPGLWAALILPADV